MRIDPQDSRSMTAMLERPAASRAAPRPTRRPWLPLLDAVMALGGNRAVLVRHTESAWASVTFAGTRHTLVLSFAGLEAIAAGEDFIAVLPEHEFTIPRQLVADAAIVAVEHTVLPSAKLTVEIELLLLEDA